MTKTQLAKLIRAAGFDSIVYITTSRTIQLKLLGAGEVRFLNVSTTTDDWAVRSSKNTNTAPLAEGFGPLSLSDFLVAWKRALAFNVGDRFQIQADEVLGIPACLGTIVEVHATHLMVDPDDAPGWVGPVSFTGQVLQDV